jgi:hypothetical protein
MKDSEPLTSHFVSAKEQMRTAQAFNFFSCLAILLMPLFIPLFIWVAASIFVYAASFSHPNAIVREYVKTAGYRFYSTFAVLVVMGFFGFLLGEHIGRLNVLLLTWSISFLLVVPLSVRDMIRASKEDWQDMIVEVN